MAIVKGEKGKFQSSPPSFEGLLMFPEVKEWISGFWSENVRRNYLYGLKRILEERHLTPKQFLGLSDVEVKGIVKGLTARLQSEGKTTQAENIFYVIRSFLGYHDRELRWKKQEKPRRIRKKAAVETILDVEDVYKMAQTAGGYSKRSKAIILSLFQSGVRDSCLCRWTYGMVKEYLYPEVKAPIPLKITNQHDTKLGGYGLGYYYTFLAKEAAQAVREYLDERMSKGWKPKDIDPIFVSTTGKPLSYKSVWKIIRFASKNTGLNVKGIWPHTLRKSFRKVLNRANIDDDTREAIMGHKLPGSRENYFDRVDLDEIQRKYAVCNFSLTSNRRVNEIEKQLHEREAQIGELTDRLERVERLLEEFRKGVQRRS